jgi:hypothetical protein
MRDPLRSLGFALEKYPQLIELYQLSQLVIESARQNDKRPAYVKLAVPDELVKALRSSTTQTDDRDLILLVRLPHEVLERAESRIVLPGEVR